MVLAQLSVYPIGEGTSLSRFVKEGIKVIKESGYTYEIGGMSTAIEVPDLDAAIEGKEREVIEARLTDLPRGERLDLWSTAGGGAAMRLIAEWRNGMLRIVANAVQVAETAQHLPGIAGFGDNAVRHNPGGVVDAAAEAPGLVEALEHPDDADAVGRRWRPGRSTWSSLPLASARAGEDDGRPGSGSPAS